jgi:hypothetical protein
MLNERIAMYMTLREGMGSHYAEGLKFEYLGEFQVIFDEFTE